MGKFANFRTTVLIDKPASGAMGINGLIKPFKFLRRHQRTYGTILCGGNQWFLEDGIIKTTENGETNQ